MISILIAGTIIVNLALIAYSIAIVKLYRSKKATNGVCVFFATGVLLDITATICMILGSSKGMITLHGFVGYSALLAMLIELTTILRHRSQQGPAAVLPKGLKIYSYIAYGWWVAAYITGAVIVALRH